MIRLIVDSTSEIDMEDAKKIGIELLPMKVMIDDEEYKVGVNLTTKEFFDKLKVCKVLPKTTQINASEYLEVIERVLNNGDEAFVMCLSSALSGSFNSLRIAKDEINSDKVEIFDTETTTFAYKALIDEALKLIDQGVSLQELKSEMEKLKKKLKLFAVIDNVKYLIKGGRLSLTKGLTATALNIKPIVSIIDKRLQMVSKSIGFCLGMKALCKMISNVDTNRSMYYAHSNDEEKAEKLRKTIKESIGIDFNKICGIGPVIGTHAGPGCVGVAYFEK